jgi:uncharacterized damage-inducible protein DinB
MTRETEANIPELDAPGAGLPAIQEFLLKHAAFPVLKRVISWDRAISIFEREGRLILALVADLPEEARFRPVLVPRMMGIEDSSRYWSLAMTLDHLMIVTQGVMSLMAALARGDGIDVIVDTATVKPGTDSPRDIGRRYEEFVSRFRERLESEVADRQTARCHPHPWFGCLNPHGWLVMLAVHQFIHRRQIAQIRKRLA